MSSLEDFACKHCNKKHARNDMCVEGMRSFISRKKRIKKVKPFSSKNLDKTFFKRKFVKKSKKEYQAVTSVIDLTANGKHKNKKRKKI